MAPVPPRFGKRKVLFGPHDRSSRSNTRFLRTFRRSTGATRSPTQIAFINDGSCAHTFKLYGSIKTSAIPLPKVAKIQSLNVFRVSLGTAIISMRPCRHRSRSSAGNQCKLFWRGYGMNRFPSRSMTYVDGDSTIRPQQFVHDGVEIFIVGELYMTPYVPGESLIVKEGARKSSGFGRRFNHHPVRMSEFVQPPCRTEASWTSPNDNMLETFHAIAH